MKVSWDGDGNPGTVHYEVSYSSADAFATGAAISTAALTASSSRTFSELRVGATYYFRVRAINGAGAGSAFDLTAAVFTLPLPSSAALSGAALSAEAIDWSWRGRARRRGTGS